MNALKKIIATAALSAVFIIGFAQNHKVLTEHKLIADGPEGIETYTLIKSVLGSDPIEAPDLYAVNHPGVKHIIEETDNIMGHHFTFLIHRDIDKDRDTDKTDRQRNEIKAYSNSNNDLKAFNGESMRYHWYFKLEDGFSISRNFSHFFQLKAVGGDYDSQPVVTISGSINSGKEQCEIMHSRLTGNEDVQLSNTEWKNMNTGDWMEIEVLATYKDIGYLKVSIKDMDGNVIIQTENDSIDMWREGCEFIRPKWGIYRSLTTKQYLNPGEERAHFANFTIQKVLLNYTPVLPKKTSQPYPFNKAQHIDTALNINWNNDENTQQYKIYFGDTPDLDSAQFLISTSNTSFKLKTLEPNKTYYWRIDAVNDDGTTKGDVWQFTCANMKSSCSDISLLATQKIYVSKESTNYAKENINDNNLESAWGIADKNQWITLDLGSQASVNYLLIAFYNGNTTQQCFNIQGSNNNIDFDTIASYCSNGISNNFQKIIIPETKAQYLRFAYADTATLQEPLLSEMHAFGCGGTLALPTQAELINPENGKENTNADISLQWKAGFGAKTHRLYLGQTKTLSEADFIKDLDDPMFYLTDLEYKQTYYWRIDEQNDAGITTGEVWSFTTTYELSELYLQENDKGLISFDGSIESTYSGYTAEGYIESSNETGAHASWKVLAENNNYILNWRYANGSTNNLSAFLKVNDKAVGLINFSPSTNWEAWVIDSANVACVKGENTITLEALGNNGLANIDYLYIAGENLNPIGTSIVQKTETNPLIISPNPFVDELSINFTSLNAEHANIAIYNMANACVYKANNTPITQGKNNITLLLSDIKSGLYFLTIQTTNKSYSQKLIKY